MLRPTEVVQSEAKGYVRHRYIKSNVARRGAIVRLGALFVILHLSSCPPPWLNHHALCGPT